MKRILALDLDGTTVGDDGRISHANIEALRHMRRAGHDIVIVTGRRAIENALIGDICLELADYVLFNMGGTLLRSKDRRILFDTFIDVQSAETLIAYCLDHGLQLNVLGGNFWKVNVWTAGLTEYTHRAGISPEIYTGLNEIPHTSVQAMMATLDAEPVAEFLDSARLSLDYVHSEPGCIDILPQGQHKWRGVSTLLEMMGAEPDQVIAIGDYDSDVSMLQNAGIGVAVANARPITKQSADFITVHDYTQDAVADVINELVLGTSEGLLTPAKPAG